MNMAIATRQESERDVETGDGRRTCPECSGEVRPEDGERICVECGLVVAEDRLDRGPTWVAADAADPGEDDGRHAGPPQTEMLHDRGLSTRMWGETDGYGNQIEPEKRKRLNRQRRYHRQKSSKTDRTLASGYTEIQRMGAALGISKDRQEQACRLYRRAQEEGCLVGHSIESIATATMAIVCRTHQLGIRRSQVDRVSRVSSSRVQAAFDWLNRDLGLPIPPPRPEPYVAPVASDLDVSERVRSRAEEIAARYADDLANVAAKPGVVAATAVYLAAKDKGESVTQKAAAEAGDCTSTSIRERMRDLEEEEEADVS